MEQVFVKAHCSIYLTVLTPFFLCPPKSLNLQTTFLSPSLESVFLSLPLSTFISLLILSIDCLKNKHNKRYTSTKREQCNSTPDFFSKAARGQSGIALRQSEVSLHKFTETSSYKRETSKRRLKCSTLKSSKRFIFKY